MTEQMTMYDFGVEKPETPIRMNEKTYLYFSAQQDKLDNFIKNKKNISEIEWSIKLDTNHRMALKGEVSEFINEARDLWKYWKDKAPDLDKLIDEAVDVIHFIHLIMNKQSFISYENAVKSINNELETYQVSGEEVDLKYFLYDMYFVDTFEGILRCYASLLYILSRYHFTLEDIRDAYDSKNKENFQRQTQPGGY